LLHGRGCEHCGGFALVRDVRVLLLQYEVVESRCLAGYKALTLGIRWWVRASHRARRR
jgi:hypothetical protein